MAVSADLRHFRVNITIGSCIIPSVNAEGKRSAAGHCGMAYGLETGPARLGDSVDSPVSGIFNG